MLKIRDIREEDREIFFEMAKDFYGGPACDHEIPQKHFEDTLQGVSAEQGVFQNLDFGR